MLKEKKELVSYLKTRCGSLVFNQEKLNTIITEIEIENNVPTGITMDIIAGRTNMEEDNEFLLFLICNKINPEKIKEFFTENEIKFYHTQQYERNDFEFPLDIQCIQVASDQWIGVADVNFLIELRKAQLINYNVNAQRTMQRIVRGNKEIYKISLNAKALKEIKTSLAQGNFIPNTITLNMPETTDWTYDAKRNILTINQLSAFDISDGYHRYVAMCQLKETDSNFNYPIELRIISFPDDKVKQFIYQEDQKTKMRKVDSASMNMSSPANIVLERLNTDTMFDLKGKILRNGGQINFGYAGNIVEYLFFKGIKTAPMNKIVAAKDQLKNGINTFVEACPEWFDKKFGFKETLIMIYGIIQNWTPEIINQKISNIDQLDKRIFANKAVKKSMLNAIDKL